VAFPSRNKPLRWLPKPLLTVGLRSSVSRLLFSDNGPAFSSKFFGVLTHVLGVKQVFTSAYRPTTNGQVERWNATLADAIAMLTFEKDWDLSVGLACVAYNSTIRYTKGYAPMELSCTTDPCPNVWTRQPSLTSKNPANKF
jgi:transposase InsO family protein